MGRHRHTISRWLPSSPTNVEYIRHPAEGAQTHIIRSFEPKLKHRKQAIQQICRKVISDTECLYYKLQRRQIGMPQLCVAVRNKLQPMHKKIEQLYKHINDNEAVRLNLKRKWSELQKLTQHLNTETNVIVESDKIVRKARRYRLNDEIKRKANHKIVEASERSLCYIDKIMGIIVEDGLIDDNYLAM